MMFPQEEIDGKNHEERLHEAKVMRMLFSFTTQMAPTCVVTLHLTYSQIPLNPILSPQLHLKSNFTDPCAHPPGTDHLPYALYTITYSL